MVEFFNDDSSIAVVNIRCLKPYRQNPRFRKQGGDHIPDTKKACDEADSCTREWKVAAANSVKGEDKGSVQTTEEGTKTTKRPLVDSQRCASYEPKKQKKKRKFSTDVRTYRSKRYEEMGREQLVGLLYRKDAIIKGLRKTASLIV